MELPKDVTLEFRALHAELSHLEAVTQAKRVELLTMYRAYGLDPEQHAIVVSPNPQHRVGTILNRDGTEYVLPAKAGSLPDGSKPDDSKPKKK